MAVSYKVGRPYHIADISFNKDPDQELYDRFYKACRDLRYFETVVLARALQISVRTVRNWKAGRCFPTTRGTAILIIDWVERGKPQKMVSQAEASEGMFQGQG